MNRYISDLHFGHANVIRFDGRPFADTKQMEEVLIDNWNGVVTEKTQPLFLAISAGVRSLSGNGLSPS